jgi:hypothetical protein
MKTVKRQKARQRRSGVLRRPRPIDADRSVVAGEALYLETDPGRPDERRPLAIERVSRLNDDP